MINLLILTVNIGGGHNAAANALKNYIEKNNYDINTSVIDYIDYINHGLSKLTAAAYEACTKKIPQLYRASYNVRNMIPKKNHKSKLISNTKSKKLIKEYAPNIVVCLHPFIVSEITDLKNKYNFNYDVFVLITDFDFHEGWISPGVNKYIVSSNFMRLRLLGKGIPDFKIHTFGIPSSCSCTNKNSKIEARQKLDLEKNITTVLLVGGSFGAGKIQDILKNIIESALEVQIVVIAGKDAKLKNKLKEISSCYDNPIRILGFTERIFLYMDAADILITKPGGLTITEAIIKQLPMIIVNPIPGQEEENAAFLLNKGLAVCANNKNISIHLKDLLEDKERIEDMQIISKRYAKPNACLDFTNIVTEYKGALCEKE